MAGYSPTPLLKKLGIKDNHLVYLVNPPGDYFELLGKDLYNQLSPNIELADVFHVFAAKQKELEKHFTLIIKKAKPEACIWVSWYKKASKIPTDITEDIIREIVLPTGWVDVKVCAVSDVWSGLKIVKRLQHRQPKVL